MRRFFPCFFLALFLVLLAVGCATASRSADYYQACINDSACYAQMQKNGNITRTIVETAVDHTPVGSSLGGFLGNLAGYLVSGLSGVLLGKKLKRC